jgi:hypothetical protein
MIHTFHDREPYVQLGYNGIAYMWIPQFSLIQYRDSLFKKDAEATSFKKWASMGPYYSSYGWCIIKKYPGHFLRYFVWPNALLYFAPPVEFLEGYNFHKTTVPQSAVKWFGYTNNQVNVRMKSSYATTLEPFPFLVSIINLLLFLGLLSYLLLKGWQVNPSFNKSILLAAFACITNAGFIIFTCAAALRFQVFPVLLSAIFSLLLIDWMARLIQRMKFESQYSHS